MTLLNQFQQNWHSHFAPLILSEQKMLLALSGGVDSTVLAHLFHQSGIKFVAATCELSVERSRKRSR
jgi:tRNA(Ile)-lysidine synthase TilS/MesJ